MNKKKKGMSHIEVVISFVMFIIFLVFLYFIFEPALKKPRDEQYIIDNLKEELVDYMSTSLTSYTLTLGSEELPVGSCFKISSPVNKNATIEDIDTYYNQVDMLAIDSSIEEGKELEVYQSGDFEEGFPSLDSCTELSSEHYSVSSQKTKNYILESKIEKTKQEYNEDISSLKEKLKISNKNFWFSIIGNVSEAPSIPEDVNVYVEEIPVIYIKKQNPQVKRDDKLIVKVW